MAGTIVRTPRRLLEHRIPHVRRVMPHEQGAVAHPVVDILPAIHIPLVGAIGTLDKNGKRLHASVIVGHAIREEILGARKERAGRREGLAIGIFESHGAVLRMRGTSGTPLVASCYVCLAQVSSAGTSTHATVSIITAPCTTHRAVHAG